MTHRDDSGRGLPDPGAGLGARPVEPGEAQFAAQVSRLSGRFGIRGEVDGFLAWRVYAGVRAVWRLWRRLAGRWERGRARR